MPGVPSRGCDSFDETRTPDATTVDVVRMGGAGVGRFAFEPGWRWSHGVEPVVRAQHCHIHHVGVIRSDRLGMPDEAGDACVIEPGQDPRVIGGERIVGFDVEARPAAGHADD